MYIALAFHYRPYTSGSKICFVLANHACVVEQQQQSHLHTRGPQLSIHLLKLVIQRVRRVFLYYSIMATQDKLYVYNSYTNRVTKWYTFQISISYTNSQNRGVS